MFNEGFLLARSLECEFGRRTLFSGRRGSKTRDSPAARYCAVTVSVEEHWVIEGLIHCDDRRQDPGGAIARPVRSPHAVD